MKAKLLILLCVCCLNTFSQTKQEFKFENGTRAFWVQGNDGWGVEDASGKEIVPKVYGKLYCYGNIISCTQRKGSETRNAHTVYDYQGNIKVEESEGIMMLTFKKVDGKWIGSSSWYGKGTQKNVGCVIDENGDFLYRYKQLEDAEGFKYLKNEITDTIVVGPGKYTDAFFVNGDVITTKVMSRTCVMNLDGTVIIPPVLFGTINPDWGDETRGFTVYTSEGSKGLAGYYDRNGNCIIPADTYPSVYSLANGVFSVEKDGKACIADSSGNITLVTKYNGVSPKKDENGNWFYVTYQSNGTGKMTLDGKIIEEPKPTVRKQEMNKSGFKYMEMIDTNGMWGATSLSGQTIIPCEYEFGYYHEESSASGKYKQIPGFALQKNGYTGYATPDGRIIISCDRYNNVSTIYNEDYFKVERKGKYGLCDRNGGEIIRPIYDDIKIREKKIIANVGIMEGVLDYDGKLIVPFEYSSIWPDGENYKVELFKKKGICDKDGKIIIPAQYTRVMRSNVGTGPLGEIYRVEDGKTCGLYTLNGEMIFPATLFEHVHINQKTPLETRFNADWYISAWNDYKESVCYYDLKGNLLYDSRQDKIFDQYFEQGGDEFKKKNYKKAIDLYYQALEVRKEGSAYYNIGAAYYNMGKYKDAIKSLRTCTQVSKSQRTTDKATDLIIECEQSLQARRERRANQWLNILGSALTVGVTIAQTNNAISSYNTNKSPMYVGNGGFKRNTNLDYLLDPRYAMMQVQQQNWNEYLQQTNGGQTMTYEEWFAIKAQVWAESQKLEREERSGSMSSTSSSRSSSSSSSTTSSSGRMCRRCAGQKRCPTCDGKGWYYNPLDLTKEVLCPNCEHNHNGKCASCGGTGLMR